MLIAGLGFAAYVGVGASQDPSAEWRQQRIGKLASADEATRAQALRDLHHDESDAATGALVAHLLDVREQGEKNKWLLSVALCDSRRATALDVEQLAPWLSPPDPTIVRLLGCRVVASDGNARLAGFARSGDTRVKRAALGGLAARASAALDGSNLLFANPHVASAILDALKDRRRGIASEAASLLAGVDANAPGRFEALIEVYKRRDYYADDPLLVLNVMYALAKSADPRALPVLIEVATTQVPTKDLQRRHALTSDRQAAIRLLANYDDHTARATLISLIDEYPKQVAEALGKRRHPDALAPLVKRLEEWEERQAVATVLREQFRWLPATDTEWVHFYIAMGERERLQADWARVQSVLVSEAEDKERVTYVALALIAVRDERGIELLRALLEQHNSYELAHIYLNSGWLPVRGMGYGWASQHGYNVQTYIR